MRIYPKGDPKGWVRTYRFEDDVLVVTNRDSVDHFRRVDTADIPAWFCDALAARLSCP